MISCPWVDNQRELEDDLVPEWRAKYINYKQGKKKIKAISKALRNANRTPKIPGRPELTHVSSTASIPYTHYDFNTRDQRDKDGRAQATVSAVNGSTLRQEYANERKMSTTMFSTSPPIDEIHNRSESSDDDDDDSDGSDEELTPLKSNDSTEQKAKSYGSCSPPAKSVEETQQKLSKENDGHMPKLALPDPALDPGQARAHAMESSELQHQRSHSEAPGKAPSQDGQRPEARKTNSHPLMRQIVQKKWEQHQAHKDAHEHASKSPTTKTSTRARFRRIFHAKNINSPDMSNAQQDAYNELDARQDDFFNFLDRELEKVEKFYRTKEDEAQDRLNKLRAQLHEHRDQRARDMKMESQGRQHRTRQDGHVSDMLAETPLPSMPTKELDKEVQNGTLFRKVFHTEPHIGKTSKAMDKLASPPPSPHTKAAEDARDYTKKKPTGGNETVPHKYAKRRLKLALQEFYRGMELLKSYAILNRTGFRKINKKYDKAVNARPPLRYLNEKVSNAHFVKSTFIDEYLVAVEDLYARYFERGNRKMAVKKLRSRLQQGDHSGSTFRNGLYTAAGTCLGIAGLYHATKLLYSEDQATSVVTAYLLQMYGGYFLALLLFLFFILNCKVWSTARINYVFVFEYDTRHVLDWRQLAEIPCFFLFLNGLFVWLNFEFGDQGVMYKYWPILLYGLTLVIMALPFKVIYYHSRKWWGFSNFRLLFAGLYPVEFRDFFLGDMYCSETYTMSQIVIFFCEYRFGWDNPAQCNSNHSMLLGFFTCLPAVWRFSQCIRRYVDSGNWFPHLANCAKYTGNILYYMSLSLYRLHVNSDVTNRYRIAFIVFGALNGLYCSFWDIFMDWSLGHFYCKHRGLREHLAYRRPWIYYSAMILNTILRHQWICYAIFTEDLQHSAAMSFFVGLAEVIRRGVWTSFRVENEHTTNVAHFRASRDIPLPYSLDQSPQLAAQDQNDPARRRKNAFSFDDGETHGSSTGMDHDLERQTTATTHDSTGSQMRRRMSNTPALRALQRVGTAIAAAHSEDFVKKRRPAIMGDSPHSETMLHPHHIDGGDSSEDDDPTHEIEGSVKGEQDEDAVDIGYEDDSQNERSYQRHRRRSQKRRTRSSGEYVAEDESLSDSSDDKDEQDVQEDMEEADRLAKGFHAGAGLRGGEQNGESSGEGKKRK